MWSGLVPPFCEEGVRGVSVVNPTVNNSAHEPKDFPAFQNPSLMIGGVLDTIGSSSSIPSWEKSLPNVTTCFGSWALQKKQWPAKRLDREVGRQSSLLQIL